MRTGIGFMRACVLFFAVIGSLVLYPVSSATAQSAMPPSAFKRLETVSPDRTRGEISRQDEYFGSKLFRRIIQYRDGRMSTIEFHPNGKPKGEVTRDRDGTATIKLFKQDGEGLYRVSVISPGRVEITDFRPDGESIWSRQTIIQNDRTTEYFDDAGRMRVQRHFEKTGFMRVKVFDGSGKLAYTQVWRPHTDGYVLDHLLEPLADGQSRKISLDGGDVSGLDYLDKAGSLIRSESPDMLGKPLEKFKLREFAPHDDPTIPAKKVPSTMIKR